MIYDNLQKVAHIKDNTTFNSTFIRGAKLEISTSTRQYRVKFFDHKTNKKHYETVLKGNMWSSPSIKYFIKWRIEVCDAVTGDKVYEHVYDCKDKRVYIHLGSKAIGDTLAWMPYVEKFRQEHGCHMVCSSFHNDLFKSTYPEIEFVNPGTNVTGLYAMYELGWYYKDDGYVNTERNPQDPKKFPLQQTASDILGISYIEIKPEITIPTVDSELDIKGDYVVIAPHASKHAAYWNHEGGWQGVIDFFNQNGYKVAMVSAEPLGDDWHDSKLGGTLTGVIDKTNKSLDEAFNTIKNAKYLVGTSSGLSWVSWALGIPTTLISGFSEPMLEMQDCNRIYTPEGYCRGCQTTDKLDPGDWEWCPFHKNTSRHFECTKSITLNTVLDNLKKELNIY